MANTCAETMSRYARAYTADCWAKLADCYNRCDKHDRQILKKNIKDMLERMIYLLDNQSQKTEMIDIQEQTEEPVKPTRTRKKKEIDIEEENTVESTDINT